MKVLIVDDSTMMRRILRRELEKTGFEIYEAADGVEALQKAAEIKPDLITMDVDMPRMNGFEAVFKIRTELKLMLPAGEREVPIIFVTANDTLEGRKKGFQVGATDFIIKPFLKGEVSAIVKNLLNPDTTLQGMTTLIVEDSGITRSILDNILKGEGINTVLAVNGREALEILKKEEFNIDLVMTDFMMPEMDGDELCRRIRFELGNKALPVIFLSAMSESSSILKIFKAGASDYIVKPFAKEELLARIRVHLESRLLNKKLFKQVNELKRLGKLKDDFLAITSHDLRSPLNGILGFTDLLLEEEQNSESQYEYLNHIKDSGDFLLTLINDVLDLGRVQSESHELEMSTVSLADLIEASIHTVRHMATPKGISIDTENKCDQNPCISGDKSALIRIFNNLLSNAIKFTAKNGCVKTVIEKINSSQICVTVVDDGIGIPQASIPFLFDKFSKASRVGTSGEKSTGLGLSITKELIERHQGFISVSSKEGQGTSFAITFPTQNLHEEISEQTVKEVPPTSSAELMPNILVVDDNQLNVKLAQTVLQKRGYGVSSVNDGRQALDLYIELIEKKSSETFDIIFMDLRMPVMDGFEATAEIRKYEQQMKVPEIPIIAMTAGTDEAWRDKSREMGLNGIITKPINLRQIEEVIHEFIHIDKD